MIPDLEPLLDVRHRFDGGFMLSLLPDASADCAFFDPQYESVLARQKYGNKKPTRGMARASYPVMDDAMTRMFADEIARVLKPHAYCFTFADKYLMGTGAANYFGDDSPMKQMDWAIWDKARMLGGMARWRCSFEVVIAFQKRTPTSTANWPDRGMSDVMTERIPQNTKKNPRHAHMKPLGIIKRLICAATKPGGLIINPCAGSFVTMQAAVETGRRFYGCDLETGDYQ